MVVRVMAMLANSSMLVAFEALLFRFAFCCACHCLLIDDALFVCLVAIAAVF